MSLLAHYKLNGDANDASGNGHHGTPIDVSFAAGKIGQAGSFNGSTSILDLSGHGFQLAANTSFAVWVKPTADIGNQTPGIFSRSANGSYDGYISLQYTASGLRLWMENDSNNNLGFGYFSHTTGDWLHLAMTKDGSNVVRCYVNKIQMGVVSGSATLSGHTSLNYFGRGYAGSSPISQGRWAGLFDDLRIYNEVLTLGQIKRIFGGGYGTELSLPELYAPNDGPLRPVLRGS